MQQRQMGLIVHIGTGRQGMVTMSVWSRRAASVVAALLVSSVAFLATGPSAQAANVNETTGSVTNTWTNYTNAGGTAGPRIPRYTTVQISCKLTGFRVADGNTWWYRIASAPWNNNFYASADAFYNNGATSGSLKGTPFVDQAVPDCGSTPAAAPSVTAAQGPTAPFGYRYAITLNNFPANTGVSVSCRDSVDPGGFYTFTLRTNASGYAFTQNYCYSADGPEHWVVAGGVTSNRVRWGAAPAATQPSARPAVSLAQGPRAPVGYRYAVTLKSFSPNANVVVTCFDSVSPLGFYSFVLRTNASGNASTANQCYSADGPQHWVVADGQQSNRVTWGSSGGAPGSTSGGGAPSGSSATEVVTPQKATPSAAKDPCLTRYVNSGTQTTRSILGGRETKFDRRASLYQVCEGWGMPEGIKLTPEMQCALIAAAATYGGPPIGYTVSRACDALGLAAGAIKRDWLGVATSKACGLMAEAFAGAMGIAAAGATSESGPGAVAVGVNTYRAVSSSLKVVCGLLFDGGAVAIGNKLEADHETRVALDITRTGKCLRERVVLGVISWAAVPC